MQEALRWPVLKSEMERGFDSHSNARFRPVLKLAPQLRVDRSANASVNADGMAKFSIYNFESGTLVGIVTAKVLTVFQIGPQYLTTMDHRMKESFYD
jgi:hypothetical protein